mmetsp:Transcript_3479/g.6699  ORF Transcript_3479/g.6699 Transcript_3479/m.6699 type:complete len:590 (+) Transcript_3479:276-2045(+)
MLLQRPPLGVVRPLQSFPTSHRYRNLHEYRGPHRWIGRSSPRPHRIPFETVLAAPQYHQPSSSLQLSTAQTVSSSVASAPSAGAGFPQLLFAFLAGGLFFSTFAAAITATIALGKKNIQRCWGIAKIVTSRVWNIFCHGLLVSWETLFEGKKWKWRESWRVLREQLTLTRQAAREGVDAMKREANLYAGATGKPFFLQHVVDHMTPTFIAATAEKAFSDSLRNIKNRNIRKLRLSEFSFGDKSPQLLSARAYELGEDGMAFDIDMLWDSELKTKLKLTGTHIGMTVPVTMKNVRFDGVVRLVLTPLTTDPPGYGAALVSFPVAPKISFDILVAGGEITNMPWLRTELMKAMQNVVTEEFLWPKRAVIPSPASPSAEPRPMLSKLEIEDLTHSDPLLRAEQELAANEIYQKTNVTGDPLNLQRSMPSKESLRMDVLLKDETGEVREGGKEETEEIATKKGLGEQLKQMLNNTLSHGLKKGISLKSGKKQYGQKKDIAIFFYNPDPGEGDWVGVFRSGAAQNGEIANNEFPVDWLYACGSKDFGAATYKRSGRITFPAGTFAAGAYEAFLIKQDSRPYLVDASAGTKFKVV